MYNTKVRTSKKALTSKANGLTVAIDTLLAFSTQIDSPIARQVTQFLKDRDFSSLLKMSINPLEYTDAIAFRNDLQCISFFKKTEGLPGLIDPDTPALEKWFQSEASCKEINQTLDSEIYTLNGISRSSLLMTARKIISRILGKFDTSELFNEAKWGPGSSTSVRGENVSSSRKFNGQADVTRNTLDYVLFAKQELPFWDIPELFVVQSNELLFVPKTSLISRPICIEPHINSFFQLGIGSMIRNRLKRVGLDIKSTQDLHRALVLDSSMNDSFSTIDLSSASDTISYNLVRDLIRTDWFDVLDDFRSPFTRLPDGTTVRLEKFSSMGNGFTFELETLIFFALGLALAELRGKTYEMFSVYGDDILIDKDSAIDLIQCLALCGFSTNISKTYISGPFRESCGCDAFLGTDVRPFFLKKVPYEESHFYLMANGIRRASSRCYLIYDISADVRSSWIRYRTRFTKNRYNLSVVTSRLFCDQLYFNSWSLVESFIKKRKKPFYIDNRFSDDSGLKVEDTGKRRIPHLFFLSFRFDYDIRNRYCTFLFENRRGRADKSESDISARSRGVYVNRVRSIPYWDSPFSSWI